MNLAKALQGAAERIEAQHGRFYDAPRPYPELARLGLRWTLQGRYWVAFEERGGRLAIVAIFHATANIPGRSRV